MCEVISEYNIVTCGYIIHVMSLGLEDQLQQTNERAPLFVGVALGMVSKQTQLTTYVISISRYGLHPTLTHLRTLLLTSHWDPAYI